MNTKIILASTSPRRKELLEKTGLEFEVIASSYEENNLLYKNSKKLVEELSFGKANAVAINNPEAIVIGGDTVVTYKGHVLGKPKDKADAVKMLKQLSGTTHSVFTGLTVMRLRPKKIINIAVEIKIEFQELTSKEINWYVNTGEPMDKAGAYAMQGIGMMFVKKITGDFSAGVGLPLNALIQALRKFKINIY